MILGNAQRLKLDVQAPTLVLLGRLALLLGCSMRGSLLAADPTPLSHAHAHNDYEHSRPLLDAMSHGFNSVEADVHLVDGRLLVAHDPSETRPGRTLEVLYLDPLLKRAHEYNGRVYPNQTNESGSPQSFLLLIDIKTAAEPTYKALVDVLAPYQSMLTRFSANQTATGAVTIILSGNRPRDIVAEQPERYVAIDGRLPDLNSGASAALIPLISDNWRLQFSWDGQGPISSDEKEKLSALVRGAHAQKRLIRFWAAPDHRAGWKALREAGVDLINTDQLAELENFLRGP